MFTQREERAKFEGWEKPYAEYIIHTRAAPY